MASASGKPWLSLKSIRLAVRLYWPPCRCLGQFLAKCPTSPHWKQAFDWFPETGVRLVSCGGRVALEVTLRTVSLITVRVLSSTEVIASVVPSVVSLGWCSVPVYVHRDRSVIHPTWSI